MEQVYITVCIDRPRLSVPDFVSQPIFLQSCEIKSGTESLGSRIFLHRCEIKSRTESLGSRLIFLHSCEIKSESGLGTRLGQHNSNTNTYYNLYSGVLMDPV